MKIILQDKGDNLCQYKDSMKGLRLRKDFPLVFALTAYIWWVLDSPEYS